MTNHMEVLPRLHFDISSALPGIRPHITPRASAAEIIASRLDIQLTSMQLTGDTLYVFGDELTEIEQKAEGMGLKAPEFILSQLSA